MKLHELPRGSYFKIIGDLQIPPSAPEPDLEETYRLGNIDGMYSYCTDNQGKIYHFVAWTEIKEVNDNDSIQAFQEAYRQYLRTTLYQS